MRNSEYWKERFAQLETSGNRIGKNTLRQVETFYAKAEKELTDKIELWYERLARNNDISMAEARKMLTSKELQEFHWTVEEYVKYGQENAISGAWMKELENASAKAHINRLEAIKLEIQQSVEKLYGNQLDAIDAGIRKVYTEGYYRTAFELQKGFGVGFEMAAINEGALSKVIKKPWAPDGMNFSDRIWRNKNMLLSGLHGSLTRSILTGAAPDAAIKELSERMHVSKTAAGRLIMTESAFFQSAAQRDCFEELDVEKYEIVATLDNRTSHICQKMDKKVFDMKDFQPGTTAPPFHVYCRSTTAPYFDDWEEFGVEVSRAARDEDGKTYSVGDMSYEEWKERSIENVEKLEYNKAERMSGAVHYTRDDSLDVFKSKEYIRQEKHAYLQYNAIKNRDSKAVIEAIYQNITSLSEKKFASIIKGFSKEDVEIAFNHVFIHKHMLAGKQAFFAPDFHMAQSWTRLIQDGKNIKYEDLVLLRHERLEHDYMYTRGLDYQEAHNKTNEKFNYQELLKEG